MSFMRSLNSLEHSMNPQNLQYTHPDLGYSVYTARPTSSMMVEIEGPTRCDFLRQCPQKASEEVYWKPGQQLDAGSVPTLRYVYKQEANRTSGHRMQRYSVIHSCMDVIKISSKPGKCSFTVSTSDVHFAYCTDQSFPTEDQSTHYSYRMGSPLHWPAWPEGCFAIVRPCGQSGPERPARDSL